MSFVEHYKRSIAKTITYRILIVIASFFLFYALTGDSRFALETSIIWNIFGMILYFLHERAWNRTNWGRHSQKTATFRQS
jgi:uncharacterized membrane protein